MHLLLSKKTRTPPYPHFKLRISLTFSKYRRRHLLNYAQLTSIYIPNTSLRLLYRLQSVGIKYHRTKTLTSTTVIHGTSFVSLLSFNGNSLFFPPLLIPISAGFHDYFYDNFSNWWFISTLGSN